MQIVRQPSHWSRVGMRFWACYEPLDLMFELRRTSDLDPGDPWHAESFTARAYSPRGYNLPPTDVLEPLVVEAVLMILFYDGKLKLHDITESAGEAADDEKPRLCA